jgi:hypothetical protein
VPRSIIYSRNHKTKADVFGRSCYKTTRRRSCFPRLNLEIFGGAVRRARSEGRVRNTMNPDELGWSRSWWRQDGANHAYNDDSVYTGYYSTRSFVTVCPARTSRERPRFGRVMQVPSFCIDGIGRRDVPTRGIPISPRITRQRQRLPFTRARLSSGVPRRLCSRSCRCARYSDANSRYRSGGEH